MPGGSGGTPPAGSGAGAEQALRKLCISCVVPGACANARDQDGVPRQVQRVYLAGQPAPVRHLQPPGWIRRLGLRATCHLRPGRPAHLPGRPPLACATVAVVRVGTDEGWLHQKAVFDGYTGAIEAVLGGLEPPTEAQEQTRGLLELDES